MWLRGAWFVGAGKNRGDGRILEVWDRREPQKGGELWHQRAFAVGVDARRGVRWPFEDEDALVGVRDGHRRGESEEAVGETHEGINAEYEDARVRRMDQRLALQILEALSPRSVLSAPIERVAAILARILCIVRCGGHGSRGCVARCLRGVC